MILELKKQKEPIFKRLASELSRPSRNRRGVNLSKINIHINVGETAVVPGKVLGSGELTKKVNVAAWTFSASAKALIKTAGGRAITFKDLIKTKPKKMRIIG